MSIILVYSSLSGNCQTQITGLLLNSETEETLSFVSIAIIGVPYGTVSNQNGEFTINTENFGPGDSIGFHHIGFETEIFAISDLKDGMILLMKEKRIEMSSVSIVAKSYSGRELIEMALKNKSTNYPTIPQKREVFRRRNSASYIDVFELNLKKSSLSEIDAGFAKEIEDSMMRYSRNYTDQLYTLYNIPDDSLKQLGKIHDIKKVALNEELGGDMDRIGKTLEALLTNVEGDESFWKFKTGPISIKVNGGDSKRDSPENQDSLKKLFLSAEKKHPKALYNIDKVSDWDWDFLQKPSRYKYNKQRIVSIKGENAYEVNFIGRMGKDYQGVIYISTKNFAVLRIEYHLKKRKEEKGFKLLGITYNESDDSGLLLYEKDELGYYLKYAMNQQVSNFKVRRPFQLKQKGKGFILNKRINQIKIDLNIQGREESCQETLVVNRKSINPSEFKILEETIAPTEKITEYSDSLWEGYSIIEPTKQMKEYQAKLVKGLGNN